MVVQWSGSPVEVVIYLLCVATSLLCAYLLLRAYFRSRSRLLIWSSICFGMLALNNLVLAVDVLLLPENDLTLIRVITVLVAASVMLFGFIWDS
jgi:hypothetical protein